MGLQNRLNDDQRQRLERAIRQAYRGNEIEAETASWIRRIDPTELFAARDKVMGAVFDRMVDKATSTPLFLGDTSVPSRDDFLQTLSEWVAFDLLEEHGPARAAEMLEELTETVRFGY